MTWSDAEIIGARGPKATLDPRIPYAYLVEDEPVAPGRTAPVATVFLTNRECPYRCLMCDLWRNTLDASVAPGDIPAQIAYALDRLSAARRIKLYNSGNFFDRKAIPRADHAQIATLVDGFEGVTVENHPRLVGPDVYAFADRLSGRLEVAMGLETVHPDVLPRLNKRMTTDDFKRAAGKLRDHDVDVRAFILVRPPYLSEEEGVEWAVRSARFALACGVQTCVVIPTRAGNGIMERLQAEGDFAPPALRSLERALDAALSDRPSGTRVLADLWDVERLAGCGECFEARRERLAATNLSQAVQPEVQCSCTT